MYRLVLASGCGLVILASLGAYAGVLNAGSPTVENGLLTVPILLQSGTDGVAALDFRLQFDPAVFRPVSAIAGLAAQQANKIVTANMPADGEYIVVMMGLNQTTLQTGEVARVLFEQVAHPEAGQSRIEIIEPTLATQDGAEIPVSAQGVTVRFSGQNQDDAANEAKDVTDEAETLEPSDASSGGQVETSTGESIAPRESIEWMAGLFEDQEAIRERIAVKQATGSDGQDNSPKGDIISSLARTLPQDSDTVPADTDGGGTSPVTQGEPLGQTSGVDTPGETILTEATAGQVTIESSGERGTEVATNEPGSSVSEPAHAPNRIVRLVLAAAAGLVLIGAGFYKLRK